MSRRRIAVLCGVVATLNALVWSLLVPPFHVPDELAHFSYAQVLIEEGQLPRDQPGGEVTPSLTEDLGVLQFFGTIGNPDNKPIRTKAQQDLLRQVEAQHHSDKGSGEGLVAASQPPLYYAAEGAVYALSPWKTVLDRLQLMRFLSAAIAGLTAFFVALFVAEALPGARWAWTGAGLAVAFQPMAGFIGGGVNGDVLLYTASAALFYGVARMLRRGLDVRSGAVVGAALFVGLFAKLTFQALVPMALLALAYAAWRGRERAPVMLRGLGIALLIGFGPYLLYAVAGDALRVAANGPPDPVPVGVKHFREMLSYTVQLYVPRLPWQTDLIPQVPLYNLWFVGLVGRFGWLDYSFPGWVNQLALIPAGLIAALAAAGLWRGRSALRARLPELVVYLSGAGVLMAVIGYIGYSSLRDQGQRFEQARYLLPLLALYGGFLGLALRGLGRRWGPIGAVVLVTLMAGHSLMAQLLTIARYYG